MRDLLLNKVPLCSHHAFEKLAELARQPKFPEVISSVQPKTDTEVTNLLLSEEEKAFFAKNRTKHHLRFIF